MSCFINILFFLTAATIKVSGWSDQLYEAINNFAGRSRYLDQLIDLPLESNLVKSALIGACFLFVWLSGKAEAETAKRRRILLITVLASLCVIATTKTLSQTVFLPRPFIQSQKIFHLENDRLVESARLAYRVPLDDENQKAFKALQRGEVIQNDLGSFPSDHSGFFMALAFGVFLACRSVGLIAVLWTFFITLGSRVITGQHSPLDIIVGSLIGIAILLALQVIVGKLGKRFVDPIVGWTLRHSALSSALLFLFIFEAVNTLEDVRHIAKIFTEIGKHLIRG
ncbi:MAG: phosphatase PAP2 family protein [Pyrinomonadaceae bacterium]